MPKFGNSNEINTTDCPPCGNLMGVLDKKMFSTNIIFN